MVIYTGDTTAKIVSSTADVVKNAVELGKKCIVFSEDKITLSLELEIASRLGGGFFDVEILTFKRYIHSKVPLKQMLSKESSVMAVRKIIVDVAKSFNCFKNSINTPNLALTLYELISQLESAKVSPSDLLSLINGTEKLSKALYNKLSDVYTVYKKYDDYVKEKGYYDSNDYLSLMPELVLNDEDLRNSVVVVVGFQSVTRQRYDVFKALSKTAGEFIAVIPYDKNSAVFTGETYKRLIDIEPSASVIDVSGGLIAEAKLIKEKLFEPEIFSSRYQPYKTDKVSVYEAISPSEEAEWLAKDILSEVRSGLRYKDITVALGSMADNLPLISRCFVDYNIPFFVQKQTPLSEHPISFLILSFLDFVRKGYLVSDFIKVVENSLFEPNKDFSDSLVNAVLKNLINRSGFKREFNFEGGENFEPYRLKIMDVAEKFERVKTASGFVLAVKYLLEKLEVENNLNLLTERLTSLGEASLADFNEKVYEKTNQILDQMQAVLGDSPISALEFKNVFLSGASAMNISAIPILNDAIYIGECKDVKVKSAKILYAIGLNGDVPFNQSDTALLSDGDLAVLDGFNLIIEPKIKVVNDRERENVAVTLCSFSEKLKLSCSALNAQGAQAHKSEVIKNVTKLFDITPTNATLQKALLTLDSNAYLESIAEGFVSEETALREIAKQYAPLSNGDVNARSLIASFYDAVEKSGKLELSARADELFSPSSEKALSENENLSLNGAEISATVLETYFSCPYKNYAQNSLKLAETETGDIRVNQTGTLLHTVTELYVAKISKVTDKISSDALVMEIFDELKCDKDVQKMTQNPRLSYALERLIKECKRVCYGIYLSLTQTKFKPKYLEKAFGKNTDLAPIVLNSKSGRVDVRGKVDRVDEYDNNVRVIDYKSGKISSQEEFFYTGNKLQLYLYMNAFVGGDVKPAGAYYYPVADEFLEEENDYTMLGKTVNTDEIISATDKNIKENGKSKIVSISYKNDGTLTKSSAVLSEDDMQKYLKYAIKISENCVDEIRSGYIAPAPYEFACNYCPYGGMCGFCEDEKGVYRSEKKVNSKTIVDAVDESEKSTYKAENDNV